MALAAGTYAAEQPNRPQQVVRVTTDPRTGKLVRRVIATAKPSGTPPVVKTADRVSPSTPAASTPPPQAITDAVDRIAASQSLPPSLVHSVIKVESNYNPLAVSSKGAQGMMQLMPATARRFGVANSFDPIDNIQGGARYLKFLMDLYKGDSQLALAAYNAGEGAVEKYRSVPPYAETKNYLILVNQQMQKRVASAPPETKPAEPPVAEVKPAGPAHIQEVVGPDGTIHYTSR
jgi:soluble lytic murein transglycosylase-like protein